MPRDTIPVSHAFTTKYSARMGRITTEVTLFEPFDPASVSKPPPPLLKAVALWDTGATGSLITQRTAQKLGLVSIGSVNLSHAGGSDKRNTYLLTFDLPNWVLVHAVRVTECDNTAGNFDVIIGMDIIARGDFVITNEGGATWLSFRMPPGKHTDYVKEEWTIKYAGVGRNDLCPCGSGKKFKQCCRKLTQRG